MRRPIIGGHTCEFQGRHVASCRAARMSTKFISTLNDLIETTKDARTVSASHSTSENCQRRSVRCRGGTATG